MSSGYKFLKKGTILYVCIGGKGNVSSNTPAPGGFNGGGRGTPYTYNSGQIFAGNAVSGGGCSHVATIGGTLKNIGSSRLSSVLLVAGGGGAGYSPQGYNGSGGGASGYGGVGGYYYAGEGGTQSSGGVCDSYRGSSKASFGEGGSYGPPFDNYYVFGGGGGLYGGGSALISQGGGLTGRVAGGGSGYIGGVPVITYKGKRYAPSTGVASQTGHGRGYIQLIERGTPTLYYGDKEVDALYYGDKEVDALFYGDREVK